MNYIIYSILISIILFIYTVITNINIKFNNFNISIGYLWFGLIFIINLLIMIFIIYYYYYKKSAIGNIGPKGFTGKIGDNGFDKKSC
jgi:hypothetical protein